MNLRVHICGLLWNSWTLADSEVRACCLQVVVILILSVALCTCNSVLLHSWFRGIWIVHYDVVFSNYSITIHYIHRIQQLSERWSQCGNSCVFSLSETNFLDFHCDQEPKTCNLKSPFFWDVTSRHWIIGTRPSCRRSDLETSGAEYPVTWRRIPE